MAPWLRWKVNSASLGLACRGTRFNQWAGGFGAFCCVCIFIMVLDNRPIQNGMVKYWMFQMLKISQSSNWWQETNEHRIWQESLMIGDFDSVSLSVDKDWLKRPCVSMSVVPSRCIEIPSHILRSLVSINLTLTWLWHDKGLFEKPFENWQRKCVIFPF